MRPSRALFRLLAGERKEAESQVETVAVRRTTWVPSRMSR